MADLNQRTGAVIDNYASALQSVEIIFATRLGEMVLLREFGAGIIELLGRALTPKTVAAFAILLAAAIDLWEPRFRVRRVSLTGSVDELRLGQAGVRIEVDWRPRGHLGDPTVESVQTFGLFGNRIRRVGA
ncbi:GPW/gp25 family protein [Terrihabitans rhizophilus]|uniref:GPW/gp25 family protein n=1 Tax=Terrihabitans rhizophilus TaxID=3092662 RepID=A0ABU4RQ42_9HYPH|nr:GPW/gp25 family protein [Terrihabitans sp. PJ23]MDX6806313.1 GPW/gp25 family protein [Terrihabitans sp. PJ23]